MNLIFKQIDILSVLVFIFATLAVTQGLKFALSRHPVWCALLDIGFFKICLSWMIGAIVFFVLHLALKTFPVTEASVLQFAIWIALTNGGYKLVTMALDKIKIIRGKA
jgi:hypothetical protein